MSYDLPARGAQQRRREAAERRFTRAVLAGHGGEGAVREMERNV